MKKLWIVAVAAMMVTACAQESDVYDYSGVDKKEIGFAGLNAGLTRNTPADGAVFANANKMYVSAEYTNEAGTASEYFAGVEFAKTGTSTVWKANPAWYYPFNGSMAFMAYSADTTPLTDDTTYTWDVAGKTVKLNCTSLDGYDDVLYSNLLSGVACTSTTAKQTLKFNHALAWLAFTFKAKDDTAAAGNIKITNVEVNGVKVAGEATVTFSNPSNIVWDSLSGDAANKTVTNASGPVTLATTAATWADGLLLPDQAQTSLTITYQIKNGGNWGTDIRYTTNLSGSWIHGYKYTYAYEIGLAEITLDATVEKYSDHDNNKVVDL